jgi:beta-glucosidase
LQGFKRIHLKPGEKKVVEFKLKPKQLSIINEDIKYIVEPGVFEISVGGVQPGIKSPTTNSITKEIKITASHFTLNDITK